MDSLTLAEKPLRHFKDQEALCLAAAYTLNYRSSIRCLMAQDIEAIIRQNEMTLNKAWKTATVRISRSRLSL